MALTKVRKDVCLCVQCIFVYISGGGGLERSSAFAGLCNSSPPGHSLYPPGPVLMSLKPGSQVAESYSEMSKGMGNSLDTRRSQSRPGMLQLAYIQDRLGTKDGEDGGQMTTDNRSRMLVRNGEDLALCSPPRTENEVLNRFRVATCRVVLWVFITQRSSSTAAMRFGLVSSE